ncbi:WD40/YVTN/BNR-like repeat-containing protein [Dictyobacter formicarum]|uniref:Glycosyl hydrolase n=1 Tax=Dictyobacter formicarum TaxID=2778368 RepID=A0ABQ3V871_9CHLR|nr:glycosyl hydrolase [Dictyobacter formicarum]GHO82154.1 glycosyl hydrolase [Dictyobacter formicarum]
MLHMYLAMEKELLVVRGQQNKWQTEAKLTGMQTTCLAADPFQPERLYCGTFGRGLWRSLDAGNSWHPIGDPGRALDVHHDNGIPHAQITSVAVSAAEKAGSYGVVYAGTEPTSLYRSEDGGESWLDLKALRDLPSAPSWSFPPRPYTNHVRWITPDPLVAGRLFVAVEAGALIRSFDGGQTWDDRQPGGPLDTHTLVIHPQVPDRLYSAAGDGFGRMQGSNGHGYNESLDAGTTWRYPDTGLQHHYLWSVAVDMADPDTILISASPGPGEAHHGYSQALSFVYRKQGEAPWQAVTEGLPDAHGTIIPVLVSHPNQAGHFYTLTNKGLFFSTDTGLSWQPLDIPWPPIYQQQHQQALVVSELS